MPQIMCVTLHSFSSEDPNFPAKHLLETKVTKKWKCEKPGEKTAFVILKFDKPYKITEIDVGNEFSGVIEIFVANSQQDPPKFQEIVLATSLMTIFEARNESNPNRVRMFNKELFNPIVAEEKWDLVKIVCSQTFSNHRKFGLSFINFHTNEEVTENIDDSPVRPVKISVNSASSEKTPVIVREGHKIGKFRFRDSNSSDEETSPFAQWKYKKDNPQSASSTKPTPNSDTKSSIKEQLKAKLNSEQKRKREKDDEKPKMKHDRNRSQGLFYDSSDDEPNEKLQKKIEKDKEFKIKQLSNSQKYSIQPTPISSPSNKFASFIANDKTPKASSPSKRKVENLPSQNIKSPIKKEIKYKPFNRLMEGVVFVISGFQNPERGIMRQKALDMGAKYRADWDDSCTHLICCYSNTPKYNQVKGKGKIVTNKWIENCFTEQKMIPWRRYALDLNEKNQEESDEEILCEWNKPKLVEEQGRDNSGKQLKETEDSDDDMLIVNSRVQKDEIQIIDSEPDSEMAIVKISNDMSKTKESESNMSQDKEVEDSNNNENDAKMSTSQPLNNDSYSDDSVSSIDITTIECHAFKNKTFYLHEDLSATDIIKLKDNIKNMLGIVIKDPRNANFIISKHGKRLPSNIKGEVVKEIWVRECFDLQAFIPTARYRIQIY